MPVGERLTKLFESFASALVGLSLPKVREWLQARAGADADIASASFESGAVQLTGMRVPIGPRGLLLLDRASFTVAAAFGSPETTLRAFAGRVVFGREGEPLVFSADVSFVDGPEDGESDADATHTWASGELTVSNAAWTRSQGVGERHPLAGRARLRVTTQRWALADGEATTGGARVRVAGRGSMQGEAGLEAVRMEVASARAGHFVDALAAILGRGLERDLPLPWGALVDGVLSWDAAVGGRAEVAARTDATELNIDVHVTPAREVRGKCWGTIGAEEWAARACVPKAWRPAAEDRVKLEARIEGTLDAPSLEAVLESPALRLRLGSPRYVPAEVARGVRVEVSAGSSGVRSRGVAELDGAAVVFDASRPPDGNWSTSVRARELRASTVARVARRAGLLARFVLPQLARVSLELTPARDLSLSGAVSLETPDGTALNLALRLSPAPSLRLDGSKLQGRVAIADALAIGLFDTPIRPVPAGTGTIAATLRGPVGAAVLSGRLTIPAVHVAMPSNAESASYRLEDLDALFLVDATRVVWNKLEARAYGGVVRSQGIVGFGLGAGGVFVGLQAYLSWESIALAGLPLDARGRLAGEFVTGALSGALRFDRRGDETAPLTAVGEARIDHPTYPAVLGARSALARYGLREPSPTGTEAAECGLRLDPHGWTLAEVRASVTAARVQADLRVGLDGALGGSAQLAISSEYLGSSAWLAVPALLAGDLEVHVLLGGSLRAPRADSRVADALGRLLVTNRVTTTVVDAIDSVYEAIAGEPLEPRRHAGAPEPRPRPRGRDTEEAIVRRLVDEGADWDAIAAGTE